MTAWSTAGGRDRSIAVEDDRHLLGARGDDRAGYRREFAPADAAQDLERIAAMAAVQRDRRIDRLGLAAHHRRIRARARPDPVGAAAAVEHAKHGRGDGRIADAEIAEAEEIGAACDRLHAVGHGGGAAAFVERGLARDVAGRQMQREVEDLQPEIVGEADLVDRGAARRAKLDRRAQSPRPAAAKCLARPRRDCRRRSRPAAG